MDREYETSIAADEASQPFVGQWNRLISTTNWEKGRIIYEWRAALMENGAAITDYSDETWSRMVHGSVSGQHTGRLRRVYERFGDVFAQYEGLYWSHFQAALDWDDAEMWLEGAVQNEWSVSSMRRQRWETMGSVADDEPKDDDLVAAEVDEDFSAAGKLTDARRSRDTDDLVTDDYTTDARSPAGPDFGDEDDVSPRRSAQGDDYDAAVAPREGSAELVRPFADLSELPEDLRNAFEAFQLAILRHKAEHWQAVSRDEVLASLDALKSLALAPAE